MLHSEESEEVQYTLYPAMFAGSLGGLHDTLILVSLVAPVSDYWEGMELPPIILNG